ARDSHGIALQCYLAPLTELTKWIGKEWIRERIVHIEQVKGGTPARGTAASRDHYLRLCFNWADLKFSRTRRGDCRLKWHHMVKSPIPGLLVLSGLLQLLRRKSLSGNFGTVGQPWVSARIKSKPNLNRHHLADKGSFFRHNQLGKNELAGGAWLRALTRARSRGAARRIGDVQRQIR